MNPIVFDALLVRGEGRTVRAIVDSICLELDAEDVIAIAELPAPAALIEGAAIPARVTLRGGARLLKVAPAAAYRERLFRQRLPFSLATRQHPATGDDGELRRAEDAFFAARGLGDLPP
jgi:hypothetical protein